MPNYLEVVRLHELALSQRAISQTLSISRNTVSKILKVVSTHHLSYQELAQWEIQEIEALFKQPKTTTQRQPYFTMPDYQELAKELAKPGVTMQLLWEEYVDHCRRSNLLYYQLTQFKKYFNDYLSQQPFSHIIHHKAGEKVEVDWGGTKLSWIDPDTGEVLFGYLFVAVLPFSGYAFALGCSDMKQANWIHAHICLFEFLGGVPLLVVSDNLRTGVTKHTRSTLILNQSYEDLANHYHTIILPARVKKPKDKASVENTVKQLTTHVVARMRNYTFFSLEEYNQQLMTELDRFNAKPFQKKAGSRHSLFEDIEKSALQSLPQYPYEYCTYQTAKVYNNCHISIGKHYYSVPYAFIGKKVLVKIYTDRLEVFHENNFLCRHSTKYKPSGYYTTDEQHLPEHSATHGKWNSARYQQWARRKGTNVAIVVEKLFQQGPEQQYYRRVHTLLKLADQYSDQKLDDACQLALEKTTIPSYSLIKKLLEQQDSHQSSKQSNPPQRKEQAYLRGAEYYDNKDF
ncbi:IS21 family transposase [Enterococcus avium]|uniref:IS21 family transposase n=1 Tax=Enterococcus avium TaxID=33945 RepID=UPI0028908C94|nr:IS21 family transposase [Enterococcus avium]MDT2429279.1 IS21 family transposase [Enterococcus avium]